MKLIEEVTEIIPNVYLIMFDTITEMNETMVRFSEGFENEHFKDKKFTKEEFDKHYKETQDHDYYAYWEGHNLPKEAFETWIGDATLSPLEQKMLKTIQFYIGFKKEFYIITASKDCDESEQTIMHEVAHGLYSTNEEYRTNVLKIIEKADLNLLFDHLRSMTYHEDVLKDEAHAYLLADLEFLSKEGIDVVPLLYVHNKLEMNFKKFFKKDLSEYV